MLNRLADRRQRRDGRSRRFHRKLTGSAALWSLGRHATSSGWTPAIPSQYRALVPLTPHGGVNGRATRAVLAVVAAVRGPCGSDWTSDTARVARPPSADFGRDCVPAAQPERSRSYSRLGREFACGPPWQFVDRVGTVQLAGLRLNALPHVLWRGPLTELLLDQARALKLVA